MASSLSSPARLAKLGIELISYSSVMIRCLRCGATWSPMLRTGGKLPARWWWCPSGCNHE